MTDTLLGLVIGAGAVGVGALTLALLTTKSCTVCGHIVSSSVKCCPLCLNECK